MSSTLGTGVSLSGDGSPVKRARETDEVVASSAITNSSKKQKEDKVGRVALPIFEQRSDPSVAGDHESMSPRRRMPITSPLPVYPPYLAGTDSPGRTEPVSHGFFSGLLGTGLSDPSGTDSDLFALPGTGASLDFLSSPSQGMNRREFKERKEGHSTGLFLSANSRDELSAAVPGVRPSEFSIGKRPQGGLFGPDLGGRSTSSGFAMRRPQSGFSGLMRSENSSFNDSLSTAVPGVDSSEFSISKRPRGGLFGPDLGGRSTSSGFAIRSKPRGRGRSSLAVPEPAQSAEQVKIATKKGYKEWLRVDQQLPTVVGVQKAFTYTDKSGASYRLILEKLPGASGRFKQAFKIIGEPGKLFLAVHPDAAREATDLKANYLKGIYSHGVNNYNKLCASPSAEEESRADQVGIRVAKIYNIDTVMTDYFYIVEVIPECFGDKVAEIEAQLQSDTLTPLNKSLLEGVKDLFTGIYSFRNDRDGIAADLGARNIRYSVQTDAMANQTAKVYLTDVFDQEIDFGETLSYINASLVRARNEEGYPPRIAKLVTEGIAQASEEAAKASGSEERALRFDLSSGKLV